MSKFNTDKIRKEASASPGDGQPKNREWLRRYLFEVLDEIDRLIGQCEMCLNYGEGADVVQQIEQRTKEACKKAIAHKFEIYHRSGQFYVDCMQAIDSVGEK